MQQRIWWQHARIPLLVFVLCASLLATTMVDVAIAQSLFFDSVHGRWIGAGQAWIEAGIHTGGRWVIRGMVAVAILVWIATHVDQYLATLRRPAAYFIVSVVLSVGIVGLLKTITNIDCPWDLTMFGGRYPFVHLFADRPDALRTGHCFPAAHASSGYALLALYFVFRERNVALARMGSMLGIGTGLVFGLAQQARGAHFVSHDVWSLFITWMVTLTVYVFAFQARLWTPALALGIQQPAATNGSHGESTVVP